MRKSSRRAIVRPFRNGHLLLSATAVAIGIAASPADVVRAQVASSAAAARDRLSWYGDPKAPDLSGVWVRADAQGAASESREGWLPWPPPLKPPFAETWKKRVAEAAAGTRTDDPVRGCLPPGMPRFDTGTNGPMLIVQTPGRATLYRDGIPVRRIWLDGRPLPAAADLESFSNGNAIGHYEGSDLVTEVKGVKDQPLDATGIPHSDALTITERFHRIDANRLSVKVVATDPVAFTRPMTSVVVYTALRDPSWEPREFLCTPQADYHPDKYVR